MKYFYGFLCILGVVLPFSQFVPWAIANGLNVPQLVAEAAAGRISAFAWLVVVVSAIALIGFILFEGQRLSIKGAWIAILGTLTIGVSFGLTLFLLLRQYRLDSEATA